MGPFIVDFVCLDRRLIVELDGGQHTEHAKYDNARTEWLCGRGCGVQRYWNDDAMLNVGSVLDDILMHLSVPIAVPPHPNPLPARGERER